MKVVRHVKGRVGATMPCVVGQEPGQPQMQSLALRLVQDRVDRLLNAIVGEAVFDPRS